MKDYRTGDIVKIGVCLYANTREYKVKIIRCDIRYGSGDYEDDYEKQNDIEMECYYIMFENLLKKDKYDTGGGYSTTLEESVKYIESLEYFIGWIEN